MGESFAAKRQYIRNPGQIKTINRKKRHRLKDTRIAQIGAVVMSAGFVIQIIGNIFFQ
jgi:hypothetical protein